MRKDRKGRAQGECDRNRYFEMFLSGSNWSQQKDKPATDKDEGKALVRGKIGELLVGASL